MQNETELTAQQIALFLGRKAIVSWKHDKSDATGIIVKVDSTVSITGYVIQGISIGAFKVKPILRRWETITEEECNDFHKVLRREDWPTEGGSCRYEWWENFDESYGPNKDTLIGCPNVWAKALEMGFDVFDWIEQGIAIDESTL